MERRTLLKTAGSLGLASLLAGCSMFESPSPSPPPDEETPTEGPTSTPADPKESGLPRSRFERVVNLGDVGVDASGSEPIDDAVESALEDDTLVVVPAGTYLVGSIQKQGVSNVGFVAAEGATPTLVPARPAPQLPGRERLVDIEGSDILVGGFELNFRKGAKFGGRVQLIAESGDVTVYDMATRGRLPGKVDGYRVEARSKDGVATVENVNMRDGAVEGFSATGIFVGPPHAGEIHIRNCDIWHFPSKGIYASNPAHPDVGAGGTVHVDGGLYKNNNDCDVRIGSAGSTVKNIVSVKKDTRQGETVTWKNPIPRRYWNDRRDIVQTRSIRLKYGRDVLIEGCEFIHDIGRGAGIITGEGTHAGGTTIRDCRIKNDASIYPILLKAGGGDAYTIENVTITGSGRCGAGIRIEKGHAGTVVRNSRIDTSSGAGIAVEPLDRFTFSGTDISVPGNQIAITDGGNSASDLPYTIRLEERGEKAIEYSLRVTGKLRPLGSLSDVSFNRTNLGTLATGKINGSPVSFGFSGDVKQVAVSPSVVVSIGA